MPRMQEKQVVPVNVVGSSTFGRYSKISSEQTYNMFISDDWLVDFPGYKKVYDFAVDGAGRGLFKSTRGNLLIAVIGNKVYKIDANFVVTEVGTLSTSKGFVSIAENLNFQICIVDGVSAYIYHYPTASALTVQALAGGLTPSYVTYHNTFFLFGNVNQTASSASWFVYQRNADTTITLVSELALQTKPDFPIAVERIPGQAAHVLVFGNTVCEVHTQIGGIQNYRRNNSISIDYGCLSRSTIASSDRVIAWLSVNENNTPVIMVFDGNGAVPISTDGIDYLMSSLKRPEESIATFVRVDGHLFYQVTFYNSLDNISLLFDFNTNKFFNLSDQNLNYHPAVSYAYFNEKTYFISLTNVGIYLFSTDLTAIDENIVNPDSPNYDDDLLFEKQRVRICQNIRQPNNERFRTSCISLMIEQGNDPNITGFSIQEPIYLITESAFTPPSDIIVTESGVPMVLDGLTGYTPYITGTSIYTPPYRARVDLSISKDGGTTWSNTIARDMNPIGKRKNMMTWERLGAANELTCKFRFWGTNRFVVHNAVMYARIS